MRTTICTDNGARLIVAPAANGEKCAVGISLNVQGLSVNLTADQCGALIFGMEQALEVMQIRREHAKREAYTAAAAAAKSEGVPA